MTAHQNANINVKAIPALHLAVIPQIGNCHLISESYGKLMRWAGPKGLLEVPNLRMLTIYHDSMKTTPPDQVRLSACLVLDAPLPAGEGINTRTYEPGNCIVGSFQMGLQDFAAAWMHLFGWMKAQGLSRNGQECFEVYYNDFATHPEQKCIVDLCIPVLQKLHHN